MTQSLDAFTRGYLTAALWSEDPYTGISGEWAEHDGWRIDAIDSISVAQAVQDCAAFQETYREALELIADTYHVTESRFGHDFWLTRNRHGCGFWDRGYDSLLSDLLTEGAHAYGEVNVFGPETTDQGNSTPEQLAAWDGVIYID